MTELRNCPGDELLIAYLDGTVTDPERRSIEGHLAGCDACVETVRCIHARLSATAGELPPPPQSVALRARAAVPPLPPAARARVPILLRLPILIPTSLAAGFLLFVGGHAWLASPDPAVLRRAAQMQRTNHATPVREEPSLGADVVARVDAGEMVEVRVEHAGWCRIALPGGGEGWIECRSLE